MHHCTIKLVLSYLMSDCLKTSEVCPVISYALRLWRDKLIMISPLRNETISLVSYHSSTIFFPSALVVALGIVPGV